MTKETQISMLKGHVLKILDKELKTDIMHDSWTGKRVVRAGMLSISDTNLECFQYKTFHEVRQYVIDKVFHYLYGEVFNFMSHEAQNKGLLESIQGQLNKHDLVLRNVSLQVADKEGKPAVLSYMSSELTTPEFMAMFMGDIEANFKIKRNDEVENELQEKEVQDQVQQDTQDQSPTACTGFDDSSIKAALSSDHVSASDSLLDR